MNDSLLRIKVLNKILNYIQKRQWTDYDDFCDELTDLIVRELPKTKSDIMQIVNGIQTPFFRLNKIDRKLFVDNLPNLQLKKISKPRFKPKILFLTSNPKRTNPLRLEQEIRDIEQKIALCNIADKIVLVKKGAVRIGDLQYYLNQERPTIVHFSGHGSELGEIVLEDNEGRARTVPPRALARVFRVHKDDIKCVVLNACYSFDQADVIRKHIDFVIGMSTSIGDEAAIAFSSAFYSALASGRSIKNAFDQGINEIMLWGIPEENIPKLLTRDGVNPSKIKLIE